MIIGKEMERAVHRVTNMIACNPGGKAILLTEEDFGILATKLMSDLGNLDVMAFKMAVARNLGIGSAKEKHKKWERLFCDRLIKEIKTVSFNPAYDFQGPEVQEYVEDFLEAYRYSYKHINFAVAYLHDGADEIINISLREKQSLMNRAFRRYGKTYTEINLLKSEIKRISGTSLDFTVEVGSNIYHFGPDGVRQTG